MLTLNMKKSVPMAAYTSHVMSKKRLKKLANPTALTIQHKQLNLSFVDTSHQTADYDY